MGSCASVHKGTPDSAMKLGVSFRSKNDKLVTPESHIKDKPAPTADPPIIKTFDNFGSKEETFFDSRAWLDSDCEDDFFSVNGDFTPSRGNTPVHHSFSTGKPQANNTPLEGRTPGSIPKPFPTGKKKRLSELFRDSISEDKGVNDVHASGNQNIDNGKMEVKPTIVDVLPKSGNATPSLSGTNSVCCSERTADGDTLMEREKSIKSVQCCLPTLISCRSFSERKKKMSPAIAANERA